MDWGPDGEKGDPSSGGLETVSQVRGNRTGAVPPPHGARAGRGFKPAGRVGPDMEKTPSGTSVGVEDPYAHVERCDHCTDEGRCRLAVEHGERDPAFATRLRRREFRCPVVHEAPEASNRRGEGGNEGTERLDPSGEPRSGADTMPDIDRSDMLGEEGLTGPWDWADCPHFRSRDHAQKCARCGLAERRMALDDERPLLEDHHLSYGVDSTRGEGAPGHEIVVSLCRWCHAKVHDSWARIDDDANPDPEAIAEREGRRAREQSELGFASAVERFDRDGFADGDGSGDGPSE
jgi:hypothetical protein